jgi:hypothetical protein
MPTNVVIQVMTTDGRGPYALTVPDDVIVTEVIVQVRTPRGRPFELSRTGIPASNVTHSLVEGIWNAK